MSDYLFNHTVQIKKNILKSKSIVLFLDYDGTLVDFKEKPTDVTTPIQIKKILQQIIKNPKITVIIVTGRSLNDIKKLLTIKGLSFLALHGLHFKIGNQSSFCCTQTDELRLLIKKIKKEMQQKMQDEKGAFLEDKELTIVLHYRLLPTKKIQTIREKFNETIQVIDHKKRLEIINGEKILEARPKGWNKGKAIEMFLKKYKKEKNILPIYIGDDITDEDAFRFLGTKGISIHVVNTSKRKTTANYWVKNTEEVLFFLQFLLQILT
jgi:trehalose 6-phosphate phosphatase